MPATLNHSSMGVKFGQHIEHDGKRKKSRRRRAVFTTASSRKHTNFSSRPKHRKIMRRLPVYLLIDTSGSMRGEPIESVKVGLEAMVSSLRQDPFALESVNISIITFDRDVKQILPLTPLDELQLPEITTPESGPTHTGQALKLLAKK